MLGIRLNIRQIRSFHASSGIFKETSNTTKDLSESEQNDISSSDLSDILRSSKIRVSKHEIRTVDTEIDIRKPRVSQQYQQQQQQQFNQRPNTPYQNEIINSYLPEEVRKALTDSKDLGKSSKSIKPSKLLKKSSTTIEKLFNPKNDSQPELAKSGYFNVTRGRFYQANPLEKEKIPKLSHNLDRALFSPGVHFLQDPRSRVYNFLPSLKKIIDLKDFDPEALLGFISSSKDPKLLQEAKKHEKRFIGSTSSMTGVLTQFYLFLNDYKPFGEVQTDLNRFQFPPFFKSMTTLPSSVIIQPKGLDKNGQPIYAIDSDKLTDQEIVLLAMGHVLETLLTTSEGEFEKFKKNSKAINEEEKEGDVEITLALENTYNYAGYRSFLMRSQLDCYDERLPGNGTFDLKTRAVCAIRYDNLNPEISKNAYQIWKLRGRYESFQREYEDLIRSGALLKYGFQARIGQMDGIYVAYHNINSFFGFQYLPLEEIDKVFYLHKLKSTPKIEDIQSLSDIKDGLPSFVADSQFKQSLSLWEEILFVVSKDINKMVKNEKGSEFPSFRLVIKANEETIKTSTKKNVKRPTLEIQAIPLTNESVETLQNLPKAFKTSFKDEIPAEQKLNELREHRKSVINFSKESAKSGVLNYKLISRNSIDKKFEKYPRKETSNWWLLYRLLRTGENPKEYLRLMKVKADQLVEQFEKAYNEGFIEEGAEEIEEEIEEGIEEEEIEEDIESEESMANTDIERDGGNKLDFMNEKIDCSIRSDMRVYSAIGKIRSKKWEDSDKNPIVYRPTDD